MENEAYNVVLDPATPTEVAVVSIAISLRRIADALTYQPGPHNLFDLISDIAANNGRDRV